MHAHMAYPNHMRSFMIGGQAGLGRSIHDEWMERARAVSATKVSPSSYVRPARAPPPSPARRPPGRAGRRSRRDSVVHHPAQSRSHLARSLPDRSMPAGRGEARRGGSDGEAARAATARRPTWPRTPLVPRILPPLPFPLLQPITSSRRRAAVCRSAPSSVRSSPPDELYKFLCIILLYTYWTPSSQWSRPRWQTWLASPCHLLAIIYTRVMPTQRHD